MKCRTINCRDKASLDSYYQGYCERCFEEVNGEPVEIRLVDVVGGIFLVVFFVALAFAAVER